MRDIESPFAILCDKFFSAEPVEVPPVLVENVDNENEAPSLAQRRLAMDFYLRLASSVDFRDGDIWGIEELDLLELYEMHLNEQKVKFSNDGIFPKYQLSHLVGSNKRLMSLRAEDDLNVHTVLGILARWGFNVEQMGYPIVTRSQAAEIRSKYFREVEDFLQSNPQYMPNSCNSISDVFPSHFNIPRLRLLPDEADAEQMRMTAFNGVWTVKSELQSALSASKMGYLRKFGSKEALRVATAYCYDSPDKVTLGHVINASKRLVLSTDPSAKWSNQDRHIFGTNKILMGLTGVTNS